MAKPADPTAPLAAVQAETERAKRELELLTLAAERARSNLDGACSSLADLIVSAHLAPAFDALVSQARELLPALQGVDVTSTASVSALPGSFRNATAWPRTRPKRRSTPSFPSRSPRPDANSRL